MSVVIAVFAHPDDEAMGPAGTIAQLAQEHDVYVLCATKGEEGKKVQGKKLENVRADELKRSAAILGVKDVHFLGFHDGKLCNSNYHDLAKKVESYVKQYKPETLMTFEMRGLSGHLDHVAVAMTTSYVYQRSSFVKKIMYYCMNNEDRKAMGDDYFVYTPPGYSQEEIDLTVDISDQWNKKERAIRCHISQDADVEDVLAFLSNGKKIENFIIHTK